MFVSGPVKTQGFVCEFCMRHIYIFIHSRSSSQVYTLIIPHRAIQLNIKAHLFKIQTIKQKEHQSNVKVLKLIVINGRTGLFFFKSKRESIIQIIIKGSLKQIPLLWFLVLN